MLFRVLGQSEALGIYGTLIIASLVCSYLADWLHINKSPALPHSSIAGLVVAVEALELFKFKPATSVRSSSSYHVAVHSSN